LHWAFVADLDEIIQMTPYMIVAFVPILIGFIFYLSKFPESYYQNQIIDLYLQSHMLWHFFVVLSGLGYYIVLFKYNQLIEFNKNKY
jgi:predicted membrane channel-forming protein YqfA (hemolysin III family)